MTGPQRSLILLILVTLVLRLGWAATLETGRDEAYHYLYTVHPDWSYFDHPPMLMYVAKLGLLAFGGWIHPLSVRIGFILLFAASTWIMYRWTADWFGDLAGFYAALGLNLSAYYAVAAGAFLLPDGPLLFFALLTMWRLSIALIRRPADSVGSDFAIDSVPTSHEAPDANGSPTNPAVLPPQTLWPWIWVGLACAGAMLSKYHAAFLPMGAAFYVMVTPSARRVLRTAGPYVACVLALVGLVPVAIWNYQHDWVSFGFQSARAMGGRIKISGLAVMLFGPMAVLFPWIWYGLVVSVFSPVATSPGNLPIARFLKCLALVPIGLFTLVSITRSVLPHWPLMGFLPLFPLLGANWARLSVSAPTYLHRWLNFMGISLLVVATAFLLQARFGLIQFPFRDPCIEISGWESVGRELASRGIVGRPNTFLFSYHWFDSGQLAFAVRNRVPVTCYRKGDSRGFAFWSEPDDWLGMDGILIDADDDREIPGIYESYFREITPLPPIQMTRGGRSFRTIKAYLCSEQIRPFPFKYEQSSAQE